MTDIDPIEGERFDRGRWPFPVRESAAAAAGYPQVYAHATPCPICALIVCCEHCHQQPCHRELVPAAFLGPVPVGETVHGLEDVSADALQAERYVLERETAAEHIKNAMQLLTGNNDEDWAHLLVLMAAARARLARALAALEGTG